MPNYPAFRRRVMETLQRMEGRPSGEVRDELRSGGIRITTRQIDHIRSQAGLRQALFEAGRDSTTEEFIEHLRQRGVTTPERTLADFIRKMRKSGELPRRGTFTRLDSEEATIRRKIWETPEASSKQIIAALEAIGIGAKQHQVLGLRRKMNAAGISLPDNRLKPGMTRPRKPLPKLNASQQAVYRQMMMHYPGIVAEIKRKHRFNQPHNRELEENFDVDAQIQVLRAAAAYEEERGASVKMHLYRHLDGCALHVRRSHLANVLGVANWKAEKLPGLLASLKNGLTLENAAGRHGMTLDSARDLVERYEAHRSQISFDIITRQHR